VDREHGITFREARTIIDFANTVFSSSLAKGKSRCRRMCEDILNVKKEISRSIPHL